MKKILKYKEALALVVLFIFSLQINAVFEGRDESLEQYQSVRNQIDIAPVNEQQKATTGGLGGLSDDPTSDPANRTGGAAPLSDSLLFFFILSGLTCGIYVFKKKNENDLIK